MMQKQRGRPHSAPLMLPQSLPSGKKVFCRHFNSSLVNLTDTFMKVTADMFRRCELNSQGCWLGRTIRLDIWRVLSNFCYSSFYLSPRILRGKATRSKSAYAYLDTNCPNIFAQSHFRFPASCFIASEKQNWDTEVTANTSTNCNFSHQFTID